MTPRAAVQMLIDEAWALYRQGRYAETLRAAERAVAGAEGVDDGTA